MIVKFLKGNGWFVAGNTTRLEDEEAKKLIKEGMCEELEFTPETSGFIPPEIPNVPGAPVSNLTCPICGKEFKTQAALKAHKAKAHKSA